MLTMMKDLKMLLFATFLIWAEVKSTAVGQADARERQAAAEAYDRGTAAYLARDYARAAQWFETANRMAPTAAALIQAIRAHLHAKNNMRAATLAIQIKSLYTDEPSAVKFADDILDENKDKYVLVEINCENCTIDLNGTLQEYNKIFIEPGVTHHIEAHFETGDVQQEVSGKGGDSRTLDFVPPPPSSDDDIPGIDTSTNDDMTRISLKDDKLTPKDESKPLSPLFTWIGVGITGALGIATTIVVVDMYAGVKEYEDKADEALIAKNQLEEKLDNEEEPTPSEIENSTKLNEEAHDLYEKGETKELISTILGISTATFAVGTGIIALFLTDWSSNGEKETTISSHIAPSFEGGYVSIKARF